MVDDAAVQTPRRARNALAVFACLLAVLALIMAAACAWRMWQWNRVQAAQATQSATLAAGLVAGEREAGAARAQQQDTQRELDEMRGELRATRDAQNALDQRTRNLETAIGQISNQQFQGRDALLLDDAEFLLRAGRQRWDLFRDADAAARAYTLADDALAQVSDQVYEPVRSAIASERATLVAASAPARMHALDTLAALRERAPGLPLTGSQPTPHPQDNGVLARAWHALSGVLRVERDNGVSAPAADSRIARELLGLDLAQAQASLLAFDEAGFRAAVQRADALLAARFDADAPEVHAARSQLQVVLNARMAVPAPQLGGALAQLRALRASHAMQSVAPASTIGTAQP
ncbi:MAG: uroporphyrinogen-III C-methyltransferase [Rhodanobacteraceae bacterium]